VQAKPGEHGLEIGPGPGFLVVELAKLVGSSGCISVLDNNPAMLALTEHRARQQGVAERLVLRESNALTLPFVDESFDFVVASQVYEYVAKIEEALAEAYRVLRPGGRLAITDTDWDTFVLQTEDSELTEQINVVWDEHLAHRILPRQLPGLLCRAGFHLADVKVVPVLNTEFNANHFGFGLISLIADFVRGRSGISNGDVDRWLADLERQDANGSYFFSLNQYVFHVVKPDDSGI
jgi:SAM-dependent methyltransferase